MGRGGKDWGGKDWGWGGEGMTGGGEGREGLGMDWGVGGEGTAILYWCFVSKNLLRVCLSKYFCSFIANMHGQDQSGSDLQHGVCTLRALIYCVLLDPVCPLSQPQKGISRVRPVHCSTINVSLVCMMNTILLLEIYALDEFPTTVYS